VVAAHYFALDHPMVEICASFPGDPAMLAARDFCRGLRIVRQPAWECLATFITSSMKQVAHIAQISHTLRRRYGRRIEWDGPEVFSYPTPEAIARLSEDELRTCALGYRAKNLLGAARLVAEGQVDLAAIARMEDAVARAELCRLPGVGEKVANCTLLFGFERVRAFPIDVWIERVLRQIYFPRKRKVSARQLQDFSAGYFGAYGGYAQQYLFHYARKTWPRGEGKKLPRKGKGD
jgi:N-glycosylase/DNA lyase